MVDYRVPPVDSGWTNTRGVKEAIGKPELEWEGGAAERTMTSDDAGYSPTRLDFHAMILNVARHRAGRCGSAARLLF